MSLQLVIKPLRTGGEASVEFPVDVDESATVEELKEQIAGRVSLPKDHIRLVCAGRIWDNAATIGSYGVSPGAVVHCLNNPPRTQPTAAQQTLTEVDPMQRMMGGGLPPPEAASDDPMEQMMAQAQRQMMQNPEMMSTLLNSPMVQQMMSNPETIRAMMRMNPRMSQLMEQRPELARMLEDPEVIQQSLRMIQNPSLMREMTRNSDRALGQLDVMPGGHSALRRAHEDFADPLYAAMAGGDEGTSSVATYEQPTDGVPNNQPLANPWGAPAPPPPAPVATPAPVGNTGFDEAPAAAAAAPAGMPMLAMMQQLMQPPAQSAGAAEQPAAAPVNPFLSMMQPPAATGFGAQQQGAAGTTPAMNPMLAMLQAMQTPPPAAAPTPPPLTQPTAQAMPAANPFAAMMQQMMSNPEQMQQAMQSAMQLQQLMGGAGATGAAPGGFGQMGLPTAPAAAVGGGAPAVGPLSNAVEAGQRVRYASQLSQLAAMGFTNETLCLQVLAQHNGRLDAAIDALLAAGDNSSS